MILVFAGAGASKAVRPEKYPTTVEFFQRLPDTVTEDRLFQAAVAYLKEHGANEATIDIEQVLWLTTDLREFAAKAADTTTVPGWFVAGNRIAAVLGRGEDARTIQAMAPSTIQAIDSLSSRINSHVYDFYGDPPSEADLAPNWIPLLRGVVATGFPIEIVTTNYDIVLEEAIGIIKAPVLTGRSLGNQPTLDTSIWDLRGLEVESLSSLGRLTKLHGSVDWARGRERIFVGTPLFQGNHERHAIIYPGFKGAPRDPLFQQLHQYFRQVLSRVDVILFIGYAFRDEYINAMLERDTPRNAQIIVLNPAERLPSIPFAQSRFIHVRQKFDDIGCEEVLRTLRSTVGSASDARKPIGT